jgi:mannosyltransferase
MRIAAKALLAVLFVGCVYRAFTQPLVHDEALTYELFITGPVANIFHFFNANHHFLNSVQMRISAAIFGDSEWALRLPALGGAALYFAAIYRISVAAFGDGPKLLPATALLSLNPFVLDFPVAARGYGLARRTGGQYD